MKKNIWYFVIQNILINSVAKETNLFTSYKFHSRERNDVIKIFLNVLVSNENMAAVIKKQDMPPTGGYKPITFKRIPAKSYFNGTQMNYTKNSKLISF